MRVTNSNSVLYILLNDICTKHKICNNIQDLIYIYSLNFLNTRQKTDINKYYPLLRKIQKEDNYDENSKYLTTKLFCKLPHKYKKGFLLYLKYDIFMYTVEHNYVMEFTIQHLHDIISYIGNRNELIHRDVFEFVCYYYGQFGFNPPTQVKFRTLMKILTEYYYMISSDSN